jgi:hypothetical protein
MEKSGSSTRPDAADSRLSVGPPLAQKLEETASNHDITGHTHTLHLGSLSSGQIDSLDIGQSDDVESDLRSNRDTSNESENRNQSSITRDDLATQSSQV